MDLRLENFKNWSPARVFSNDAGLYVDWIFAGGERFTAPFHDDTIQMLLREPFNLLFRHQTPVEFLGEMYEKSPGVSPKGFIFHVSRCGSTLVSQMLGALEKNIVISEAAVLDKIIRDAAATVEEKIIRLRWMINALAQKRFEAEENLFVKFDSWTIFNLPLIEKAFPDVPWIFLYRNPVEVIVSHLRQPGRQMIPGAVREIFPEMDLLELLQLSPAERIARTIGEFCRAALDQEESPNGKFVNYDQLPEAVAGEICEHFKAAFSQAEIAKMTEKARFNAKTPQISFSSDAQEKRAEASIETDFFAEKFAAPLYEKLEKRRQNGGLF